MNLYRVEIGPPSHKVIISKLRVPLVGFSGESWMSQTIDKLTTDREKREKSKNETELATENSSKST